ncbi:MFS transporter [Pelagicoccus sp. SDUM812005]|uniref:MFS transporter n=1 Tax=Pelagicoccus sp. SDUM812005 TaxID=3041257 RepID=UPI00280D7AE7|nr:MFS transporter [Pelagicoccus sp. SDUM812005]MDQ8180411.1 MFS transporter [Pelagicoccus sp. SDUM812005]
MTQYPATERLSLKEKIGYGLGDMASNFYMGFFGLFLLYYYTDVWGISPAAAATMLLVTKIVDAISDPAMGLIADRTQSRWGKYRPYLLWVAIPYALLGYLLFMGPDLSEFGKLAFAYVSYTLVMLAYTAINVPYSALLAVISPVAEERTKATQFRFVFASLGTLTVGAMAKPLVNFFGGDDELLGFRLTIVLFAILSVLIFWITFATTKERIQPKAHNSSVREDMAALLKNGSWIVLMFAGILIVVGLVARFASLAFYTKYYLGHSDGTFFLWMDRTSFIVSCGLVGQLLGALVTPSLVKRGDKKTLMVGANLLHAGLLFACYFVSPDAYMETVVLHTLGIFTFGVVITLLFAMYTDCAEYGEWKTGKNCAGLTVSASMFSLKFGSAVGGALPGFILAWFGFVANQQQSDTSLMGIRLMSNALPALFFLGGGLLMVFYKIDRGTLRRMETELADRRARNASA